MVNGMGSVQQLSGSTKVLRAAAVALLAVGTAQAWAAPFRVQAQQDQTSESFFALDFGAGGVASASITRTNMELEIDGITGAARFVSYDQDVDALQLPGGLSTGAMRVQIVPGSSTGTYDRTTGEFVTNELYSIEFDGDLSAFGLTSPVILPSQSVGVVDVLDPSVGTVTMNWAGSNLNNPNIPLDFSYICTLFASFQVTAASFIENEMVGQVTNTAMSAPLKTTLLVYLNDALAALDNGNTRGAVGKLNTFILKTRTAGAANIALSDAQMLVSKANEAIRLIQGGLSGISRMPLIPTEKQTSRIE